MYDPTDPDDANEPPDLPAWLVPGVYPLGMILVGLVVLLFTLAAR